MMAQEAPPSTGGMTSLGTGDSSLRTDLLDEEMHPESLFEAVRREVQWSEMRHKGGAVPRLVCMQGSLIRDCTGGVLAEPVYRHPADEQPAMQPWTPTVDAIRQVVEASLGQELNHAIIQWYRGGEDFISEHSDKTLDIVRGSAIVNVSLGATRLMVLRDKKGLKPSSAAGGAEDDGKDEAVPGDPEATRRKPPRQAQRVPLPNNSLFILGWETNLRMTHEIRQDKRLGWQKTADELAYGGQRISLTFRHIGTFQRRSDGRIYGQGAPCKTEQELDESPPRVRNDEEGLMETDRMIRMMGNENRDPNFDWEEAYGEGFEVMNMKLANHGVVVAAEDDPPTSGGASEAGLEVEDAPCGAPSPTSGRERDPAFGVEAGAPR